MAPVSPAPSPSPGVPVGPDPSAPIDGGKDAVRAGVGKESVDRDMDLEMEMGLGLGLAHPRVLIVSRRTLRKNKFVDFVGEYHLDLIVEYGAVPVIVPRVRGISSALDAFEPIHGVLLCEGEDIDPSLYQSDIDDAAYGDGEGEVDRASRASLSPEEAEAVRRAHASDVSVDAARDSIEMELARRCLERSIPYLGICRGCQVLNVATGGSLYQDVETELTQRSPAGPTLRHIDYNNYDGHRHTITVVPGTPLAEWFAPSLRRNAQRQQLLVNSYHHQGIKRLGARLRPMAFADDGLCEAFYDPACYSPAQGRFLLGLQFHPERMRLLQDADKAARLAQAGGAGGPANAPHSAEEFEYPECPRVYQEFVRAVLAYAHSLKAGAEAGHGLTAARPEPGFVPLGTITSSALRGVQGQGPGHAPGHAPGQRQIGGGAEVHEEGGASLEGASRSAGAVVKSTAADVSPGDAASAGAEPSDVRGAIAGASVSAAGDAGLSEGGASGMDAELSGPNPSATRGANVGNGVGAEFSGPSVALERLRQSFRAAKAEFCARLQTRRQRSLNLRHAQGASLPTEQAQQTVDTSDIEGGEGRGLDTSWSRGGSDSSVTEPAGQEGSQSQLLLGNTGSSQGGRSSGDGSVQVVRVWQEREGSGKLGSAFASVYPAAHSAALSPCAAAAAGGAPSRGMGLSPLHCGGSESDLEVHGGVPRGSMAPCGSRSHLGGRLCGDGKTDLRGGHRGPVLGREAQGEMGDEAAPLGGKGTAAGAASHGAEGAEGGAPASHPSGLTPLRGTLSDPDTGVHGGPWGRGAGSDPDLEVHGGELWKARGQGGHALAPSKSWNVCQGSLALARRSEALEFGATFLIGTARLHEERLQRLVELGVTTRNVANFASWKPPPREVSPGHTGAQGQRQPKEDEGTAGTHFTPEVQVIESATEAAEVDKRSVSKVDSGGGADDVRGEPGVASGNSECRGSPGRGNVGASNGTGRAGLNKSSVVSNRPRAPAFDAMSVEELSALLEHHRKLAALIEHALVERGKQDTSGMHAFSNYQKQGNL